MILGQISYLDCIVFLIFLAPQLLLNVNIFELLTCIIQALPFFCKNSWRPIPFFEFPANIHGSLPITIRIHI